MPRRKSLGTVIQDMVRREVASVMGSLLSIAEAGSKGRTKKTQRKTKNGRRKRRGPGRPPGSKNKTARAK